MFKRAAGKLLGTVLLSLSAMGALHAQTVTVGLSADVTSVDPHYYLYSPNQNIADHIYNRLIERNEQLRLMPGLALSWKPLDDLTWEFKLRPNVTFHDGSPITAEDVVFSIGRVPTVKDSPGSFTVYTKEIDTIKIVDPLTLRIKTKRPHALLPNDLSVLSIIPKHLGESVTTADFNAGKASIGTGPYKLAKFTRGDRIELVRNDAYWGKKPQAQSLVFKLLTNDATRVAALLSGDVQAIDAVPVADIKRLSDSPGISLTQRVSSRLIFLYFDVSRSPSPFVTDKEGKPLADNPLEDVRVRKAISKAIDREVIRARVMEGMSRPTAQLVIAGMPGYDESLKLEPVDVAGAKKLLAEAGYPNGFNLTLQGPNNRYVQDDAILQTVAQMVSRIGITVKVEAFPAAVFFPRNNRGDFSFSMSGWIPDSGEASSPLRAILATKNRDKGYGAFNANSYSNAKVDELVDKAMGTLNDAEREKLLQQATGIAMSEQPIAPLHHQVNVWATRKNVKYAGRSEERTYGFEFELREQ